MLLYAEMHNYVRICRICATSRLGLIMHLLHFVVFSLNGLLPRAGAGPQGCGYSSLE